MNTTRRTKPKSRRKPCAVCHIWFTPSSKLGDRQRACSRPCSHELDLRRQAEWRRSNPGYQAQRRADADVARLEQAARTGQTDDAFGQVLGPAPPFYRQVPWEVAKTAMGAQGLVLLAKFGRLACRAVKTAMRAQRTEIKAELDRLRREV